MTDRPIIFSAPMVRALLDGRKTQTRRVLKPKLRPSYVPGDRLWVREAWRSSRVYDDDSPRLIPQRLVHVQYEATEPVAGGCSLGGRLRPSIHMPRWASRLTLDVTDVRVQRLQEISECDARAEGVSPNGRGATPREQFHGLWNSIYGPEAWDADPWVAALTFDVTVGNIDRAKPRRQKAAQ